MPCAADVRCVASHVRSYGGTVVADIFSHLGPRAISGIIYIAAVPWNGLAFQEVAHPSLISEVLPSLVSFDNVTAALDIRIKIGESVSNEPEKVPAERKWSWIGSAALVGPLSTQLLFAREQDPEPLLRAGAAGFPTLLITGGKDTSIQSGGHAMFYDFEEEYVREIGRFAASVFGNNPPAQE
ncbi:hypothetical protein BKA70DRAFT_1306348 [Coprinopsis sp. MPI-PUGE-AT-0042]|nr:hypothetical protein BKA70DRAFT_1306348 [Coprinopsis sp. MPI-PUGE-AT-0042]